MSSPIKALNNYGKWLVGALLIVLLAELSGFAYADSRETYAELEDVKSQEGSDLKEQQIDSRKQAELGKQLIEALRGKSYGDIDVRRVKSLINAQADLNQRDDDGFTALIYATVAGHSEIVKLLLEKGAYTYQAGKYGRTSLHRAVNEGHLEIVKLLLEKGADPNQADKILGWTPLDRAVNEGHLEIVKLLLEKGADPNQADKILGLTPLYLAANEGHLEIVRLLQSYGAR